MFATRLLETSWMSFGPELCLFIAALGLLLLSVTKQGRNWERVLVMLGVFASAVFVVFIPKGGYPDPQSASYLAIDMYSRFFHILFLMSGSLAMALLTRRLKGRGDIFYALVLLSTCGLMVMVSARDLWLMVLGMELATLSLCVLVGYLVPSRRLLRVSVYLFLYNTVGSVILLFGIVFLYGAIGHLHYDQMALSLGNQLANKPFLAVGSIFLVVGFGMKMAVVPFHSWMSDAIELTWTPLTNLLDVTMKLSVLAVFLRWFIVSIDAANASWLGALIGGFSILAMLFGSFSAVTQRCVKKVLYYAALAHTGFFLLAIISRQELGVQAVLVYALVYVLMYYGAYTVLSIFEEKVGQSFPIEHFAGFARRYPGLAFCMLIFLCSMSGVPPTAGFMCRWLSLGSVMKLRSEWGFLLLLSGGLASILLSYAFLRVLYTMYVVPASDKAVFTKQPYPLEQRIASTLAVCLLLIGLFPHGLLYISSQHQLRPNLQNQVQRTTKSPALASRD
tara:strand:+ start:2427 stop:3941 length:1515 start_codon:yes stop_codon:yes gene_type:complete